MKNGLYQEKCSKYQGFHWLFVFLSAIVLESLNLIMIIADIDECTENAS